MKNESRRFKTFAQILFDILVCTFSFWLAWIIRLDGISTNIPTSSWLAVWCLVPVTLLLQNIQGVYDTVARHITYSTLIKILSTALTTGVIFFTLNFLEIVNAPRSLPFLYTIIFFTISAFARLTTQQILLTKISKNAKNLYIFYSDPQSATLVNYFANFSNSKFGLKGLISNKRSLSGKIVNGYKITHIDDLQNARDASETVIFDSEIEQTAEILKSVEILVEKGFSVKKTGLVSQSESENERKRFEDFQITEIMDRQEIPPINNLLKEAIESRSILITGAGGSIGSEILQRCSEHSPAKLIALDHSENAIYRLNERFKTQLKIGNIETVLASVADEQIIENIIIKNKIDTIFHCAAYKHVNICEKNIFAALDNNAVNTLKLARLAGKNKVERFTLISSDKAVRPTNYMGATKRLAELAVELIKSEFESTKYVTVRFGNVIGSSGSVIPKFQEQIMCGGPVTVTDKNVIRYFMSAKEASELVLQASSIDPKGGTYILDMGRPVNIHDLAVRMIRLSGAREYYGSKPGAHLREIQIKFTGLGQGEKLFEELLVEQHHLATQHLKIYKEKITPYDHEELETVTAKMLNALKRSDKDKLHEILRNPLVSYNKEQQIEIIHNLINK
ncbi:polysaccharide biosynthesis protein [Rhodobacterales bacterium HKCCA1058]|nr:polysaccharide biosynthesis protein [Rhodobacterales bacterium HKCCA1058]